MNGTSKKLKLRAIELAQYGEWCWDRKYQREPEMSTGLGRPIETEEQCRAETIIPVSNHLHCPLLHQQ